MAAGEDRVTERKSGYFLNRLWKDTPRGGHRILLPIFWDFESESAETSVYGPLYVRKEHHGDKRKRVLFFPRLYSRETDESGYDYRGVLFRFNVSSSASSFIARSEILDAAVRQAPTKPVLVVDLDDTVVHAASPQSKSRRLQSRGHRRARGTRPPRRPCRHGRPRSRHIVGRAGEKACATAVVNVYAKTPFATLP